MDITRRLAQDALLLTCGMGHLHGLHHAWVEPEIFGSTVDCRPHSPRSEDVSRRRRSSSGCRGRSSSGCRRRGSTSKGATARRSVRGVESNLNEYE